MEETKLRKQSSWKVWFSMGALIFGTYCGANMAGGAYAAGYMVTVGGGWMFVWLGLFFAFMAFFTCIGLNFVRSYGIYDYKDYYLTLWGMRQPAKKPLVKVLRLITTAFFDVFGILSSLLVVGSTIALLTLLLDTFLHIPPIISGLLSIGLFAVLTMNGAAFLRKFNVLMIFALLICFAVLIVAVLCDRGSILAERLGNFQIGADWNGSSPKAHMGVILAYCFTASSWGSALCPYAQNIKTKKDAIGSGFTTAFLVIFLFGITSLIVLPYMPEIMGDAPILDICKQYLPKWITVFYWILVLFSVITTAPTYTYNQANRWCLAWKSDKVTRKTKILVISLIYLTLAWAVSTIGLMNIVQKCYTALGELAVLVVVLPLLVSIFRVAKRDRAAKKALAAEGEKQE